MQRKLNITFSYNLPTEISEDKELELRAYTLECIAEQIQFNGDVRKGVLVFDDDHTQTEYHGTWEMVIDKPAQTTKYLLKEDGIHVYGNGFVELNEKIRDEEEHEYYIVDRKDFIKQLIQWISECENSDKILMTEDLQLLMNWKDDYIFTSNSTNSYIGSLSEEFNSTCEELIELNEQY